MSTLKSQLLDVVNALPDECTMEDFRYSLYLRMKAEEGLAAMDAGQTCTTDEVREMIKSWRKSYGPSRQ